MRPPSATLSSSTISSSVPTAPAAAATSSSSMPPSRSTPIQGSSVLTRSPGVAGDGLSPSSGVHSGSSQGSQHGGSMYYQSMSGSWQAGTPGSSSSAYTFANPNLAPPGPLNPPGALLPSSSYAQNRQLFGGSSPSLSHFGSRPSHSPGGADGLPQPGSYHGQSPFPTQIGGGGGPLPTLHSQGPPSTGPMTTHPPPQSILSSQGPPSVTQAPSASGPGVPHGPAPPATTRRFRLRTAATTRHHRHHTAAHFQPSPPVRRRSLRWQQVRDHRRDRGPQRHHCGDSRGSRVWHPH